MRMTREQSQVATREHLVACAHAAIARGGMSGFSLRGLCAEAGYTQGAFYSNFSSRDDLLLEVMRRNLQHETEVLRRLMVSMQGENLHVVLRTLAERFADLAKDTRWSLLAIELQLHAQRDPDFATAYNAAKIDYHSEFAMLIGELAEQHRLVPVMPPLQAAIGLYALWSGLVVQGTIPGAFGRDEIFLSFLRAVLQGGGE